MMPDINGNPLIFSTRILDPYLTERVKKAGIGLLQEDFIEVSHEFDGDSFLKRLNNPDTQARVFTSKNAVYSLQKLSDESPIQIIPKKNFTVGIKATEMLEDFGIKTDARAGNAISLAQIIARNKDVQSLDFFCGDKSLDDLSEYLESKGVRVHKEIVYKTELVSHEIDTSDFDGAIFLSPTAAFSFFKKNKLNLDIPCFCIGATTSEAVHFRCNNKRLAADEPSIESVVDKVIQYFENHKLPVQNKIH